MIPADWKRTYQCLPGAETEAAEYLAEIVEQQEELQRPYNDRVLSRFVIQCRMTTQEARIASVLCKNKGRAIHKKALMQIAAKDGGELISESHLSVMVYRIREKLKKTGFEIPRPNSGLYCMKGTWEKPATPNT
jgi:DNA-binding response OmpR family regulator